MGTTSKGNAAADTRRHCLPLKALVNRCPGYGAGGHGDSSRNRPAVALQQENAGAWTQPNMLNAALPRKRSVSLMDNSATTWRRVAEPSGLSHDENSKENGHAGHGRRASTRKKRQYKKKQVTASSSPPKPVEGFQEQDGVRDEVREDTTSSSDPVTVSCAARLHSEVYLRVTGEHLAEVEKVLQAVSPSIQAPGRRLQQTSCRCMKTLPSVALGAVWDWYDYPSSYGVEVRHRDGASHFNAYFVPYLSAVQLFRRRTGLKVDQESVYEFFETEQPQLRLPLLQKIRALTGQNSSLRGTGDSSALQRALLADLDPLSWFAVAWYPIYKIPEGELRSVFLTYHSLGHLAPQNDGSVSLPAVGLQTYHCKPEEWLSLGYKEQRRLPVDVARDMLEQRMVTLQKAAEALSVAGGSAGFSHADFHFFSSRNR